MDIGTLERTDASEMHKIYDMWPEIAKAQYASEYEPFEGDYNHIVFAGMGGSGAIGSLLASILSGTSKHVDTVKGYMLPKSASSDSLVVAISISGNTAETLSVLSQARKAGCTTAAFSDGGKIKEFCGKYNAPHYMVRSHHSPRASFAPFLYSILRALGPVLGVDGGAVDESLSYLQSLRSEISSQNLAESNGALSLASWLPEVPVIYHPWGLGPAAMRFKNSLQENAKMHAMAEDVIEACHNGIVAMRPGGPAKPVLVRGAQDHTMTQKRWKILCDLFERDGVPYKEVHSPTGHILTKLAGLVYLFDYTTIYKAVLRGIDPAPVPQIDYVKGRTIL